jgi:hypothetical protein
MSSWGAQDHYASGRASPPRDERRRDSRYGGEPNYGSYEDNVRDWEEQERLRQWDEYERARTDWERRVNEYKSGDGHRYGNRMPFYLLSLSPDTLLNFLIFHFRQQPEFEKTALSIAL